jgi:hypothetical protein
MRSLHQLQRCSFLAFTSIGVVLNQVMTADPSG